MPTTNSTTVNGEATTAAAALWFGSYPLGVPREITLRGGPCTLGELLDESFQCFAERTMYSFMGAELTYADVDRLSSSLGAHLQSLGLERGTRIAVMLPNIPQYPIAAAAILRSGFVLVNVNPLYTARELEHQLKDSQARVIVILETSGATLQQCIEHTDVSEVIVCGLGDLLALPKALLDNFGLPEVKERVPGFEFGSAIRFPDAVRGAPGRSLRPVKTEPDDIAVLQYTGGTTGVSKGAVLLHRNLVANALQNEAWLQPALGGIPANEQPTSACVLPLYHILAFVANFVMSARAGGKNVLIADPRNTTAALVELSRHRIHFLPGVNTLFSAFMEDPAFHSVDWSHLRAVLAGGMPMQSGVMRRWKERTGRDVCEGYGLSEAAGTVTCNPTAGTVREGIGLPLPSTEVAILSNMGEPLPDGDIGELAVRGPQMLAGYWSRGAIVPACDKQGFFRTGDLGRMHPDGHFQIVDRKKDMVLVSGFNVYPSEIEDFVAECPGVAECAAIGIPDSRSGEAIKLVIVRRDPTLTEETIRSHCRKGLTGYKQPAVIEFRASLPKTPVGKILRKDLR